MWAKQYSKRLITFIFVVWSIGALYGFVYEFLRLINTPETATLDSLYIYLAVPMTCGVTSYLIANTLLNKEKVKQNYIPDYDQTVLGGEYAEEDGIGTNPEGEEEQCADGFYAYSETFPAPQGDPDISHL